MQVHHDEWGKMVYAVQQLDLLIGHLRTCNDCYDHEPCLEIHTLVKDVQNKTEAARAMARGVYIAGIHGPPVPPKPPVRIHG